MAVVKQGGKKVFAFRMVGGKRVMDLDPSSLGWGLRLNKAGSIEIDVKVGAEGINAASVDANTVPKKFGLAVHVGSKIIEAGHITSRTYSPDGKTVTLAAAGIWSYLEWLKVMSANFDPATSDIKTDVVTITGQSLRGIAGTLLLNALNSPANIGRTPPILCAFAGEAGTNRRTFYGRDLATVAERQQQLAEVSGGPDQAYVPEFTDASQQYVQWRHVAGAPLIQQTGNPYVFDHTVTSSIVTGLGVDEDGTGVATRVWTVGAGSDSQQSFATGTNTGLLDDGFPILEGDQSFDVDAGVVLLAHTDQYLLDASSTWSTWQMNVRAADPSKYVVGGFAHVFIKGHGGIPDGKHLVRIVGLDGDHADAVKVSLQPMRTTWENFDPALIQRRYLEPDKSRAEAETARQTARAVASVKAANSSNGLQGTAKIWQSEVTGFDSSTDSAMYKVKDIIAGGTHVWAWNYRGLDLALGDEVILSSDNTPGHSSPLILAKMYEGGGGGGGVSAERAVVSAAVNEELTATIQIGGEGDAIEADNYAGRLLASGDDVAVVTDGNGAKIILGKGLSADGTVGSWGPVRVSLGYPLPVGEYNMAPGEGYNTVYSSIEDVGNALGFGAGSRFIDSPFPNNVYPEPATGVLGSTGTPGAGWTWIRQAYYIHEGKFFQWFQENSTLIPYLFTWDAASKVWSKIPGLPTGRSILDTSGGYWSIESVRGEPAGNLPTVAMIHMDTNKTVSAVNQFGSTYWFFQGWVTLWQVAPDGLSWRKSQRHEVRSTTVATQATQPTATALSTDVWHPRLLHNGSHYYVACQANPLAGASRGNNILYINANATLSISSSQTVYTQTNGNFYQWSYWFTGSSEGANSVFRVRLDGPMYHALTEGGQSDTKSTSNRNLIRSRQPGGATVDSVYFDSTTDPNGLGMPLTYAVACHVSGPKYVVSAKIQHSSAGNGEGLIIDHDAAANTKSTLVAPATPPAATAFSNPSSSASAPIRLADGSVTVTCRPSAASPGQASEKMYKFSL